MGATRSSQRPQAWLARTQGVRQCLARRTPEDTARRGWGR
jgi:hypothetical protein